MRILRILIALVTLGLFGGAGEATAQDWWFGFTWGASVPTSDTKDFTDKSPSWRNFGVEGRKSIHDNWSLGFSLGWNVFNEVSEETAFVDDIAVTGTQFRFLNSFPLLMTGHYYIGKPLDFRGGVRAFVGAGVGAYVAESRIDIGLTTFKSTDWHFGVAPEAGVAYKFRNPFALFLSGKYNWTTETAGRRLSYWNFNVGAVWSN